MPHPRVQQTSAIQKFQASLAVNCFDSQAGHSHRINRRGLIPTLPAHILNSAHYPIDQANLNVRLLVNRINEKSLEAKNFTRLNADNNHLAIVDQILERNSGSAWQDGLNDLVRKGRANPHPKVHVEAILRVRHNDPNSSGPAFTNLRRPLRRKFQQTMRARSGKLFY